MDFNSIATGIFFLAIAHVFIANQFTRLANSKKANSGIHAIYSFLGNPALIFGLWLIPIFLIMGFIEGWASIHEVLKVEHLLEPFSYFVLIAIATVRPLQKLFTSFLYRIGKAFNNHFYSYWLALILITSMLTGVFSAVAIMTLVCFHLSGSFFQLKPSVKLMYTTFALLLLGISMGSTIIPVNFTFFQSLINGDWNHVETFQVFGWKIFIALSLVCILMGSIFKKEFAKLNKKFTFSGKPPKITFREIYYGFLFLVASIGKENPYVLGMVIALIIIAHKPFYRMKGEEGNLQLYFPLVVAFFTYTLEIHASFQKWWVLPLFEQTEGLTSYFYAFFLTGLNEHVPLEALRSTFENTPSKTQFLSFLGILAGGGLTIIAKSANIVAKLKLREYFPNQAISPILHLFLAIPLGLVVSAIVVAMDYLVGAL